MAIQLQLRSRNDVSFTMVFRRSICLSLCAFLLSPFTFAQQPASQDEPTTTISVNARLVNLPVIVHDKKGAIIQNLTKTDFALNIDGHAQTIRYFDKDSDLPLTLGLLVDVSGSVSSAIEEERSASEAFLDEMMRTPEKGPPDKAFLIQFAHEAELLRGLTSSRPKLREALNQIGTPPPDEAQNDPDTNNGGGGGNGGGRRGGHRGGGGTTLYDAIFLASDELMQKQQGRKALVVLTDGEDRGSKESLASSISAAQRSETVVYAIYFKGEQHGGGHGGGFPGGHGGGFPGGGGGGFPGGGSGRGGGGGQQHVDGKKIIEQITGETGGRMFEISSKQNFASIYSQIADELRSQYRLGFTPDPNVADDGFHRVELTVPKQKKLIVQSRDGYYSGK